MNIWATDLQPGDTIWYEGFLYEIQLLHRFANGRSLTVTVWKVDTGEFDQLWLEYSQQIWREG